MTNTDLLCARCSRPILDPENAPTDGSGVCAIDADPDGTVSVERARELSALLDVIVDKDEVIAMYEDNRDYYVRCGRMSMAARVCDQLDVLVAEREHLAKTFLASRAEGIAALDD